MKLWIAAALLALPLPAAAAPDIPAAIYTDPRIEATISALGW